MCSEIRKREGEAKKKRQREGEKMVEKKRFRELERKEKWEGKRE